MVNILTRDVSSILNLWYLDDGAVDGSPDHVMVDLVTVIENADELGLELNMGKCELFVTGGSERTRRQTAAKFRMVSSDICILGPGNLELLDTLLTGDSTPPPAVGKKRSVKHKCWPSD